MVGPDHFVNHWNRSWSGSVAQTSHLPNPQLLMESLMVCPLRVWVQAALPHGRQKSLSFHHSLTIFQFASVWCVLQAITLRHGIEICRHVFYTNRRSTSSFLLFALASRTCKREVQKKWRSLTYIVCSRSRSTSLLLFTPLYISFEVLEARRTERLKKSNLLRITDWNEIEFKFSNRWRGPISVTEPT